MFLDAATTVNDIKKLAGIVPTAGAASAQVPTNIDRRRIERERNIKPGTPEWFQLWFAKPQLTGERPYDEVQ